MDDELLNALYGVSDEQYDDDDLIKEAQAELVESVAAEAGIDLGELDDDELDKFAEYVLTGGEGGDMSDPALAEADRMGRAMAHAYADEQIKIAHMIDEGSYPGLEYDEYENAFYAQAARWEMLKEAGAGPTGDFGDLSYADRMRIAKGNFGKDDSGKKYKLSDTDYSKRQRAMAMIGRGTGYYDIKSGRKILRNLKELKGTQSADYRKQFMKRDSAYRAAMKELTPEQIKAVRRALIQNTAIPEAAIRAAAEKAHPDTYRQLGIHQSVLEDIGRKTGRGLIARGVGKAAITTGAGGMALYGLKRAFGN